MKSTAALSLCNLLGLGLAARIPLTRNTTPNFSDRNFNINTDNLPTALVRRTCGETAALICYGVNRQGTSQNLDVDNITYAAGYLRYLADTAGDSLLWTMPPEFDYSEWSLPVFGPGTVLALAKHINPCTNSSVTYYDLARTIDGGADATPDQVAASLLGSAVRMTARWLSLWMRPIRRTRPLSMSRAGRSRKILSLSW